MVRKQNANLKSTKKAHFTVTYRPLKKLNKNSLIKDLNEVPWTVLDTFDNDPDEMLSTWEALVLDVVDRHAPLKSVRVKSMKKPLWLSDEILRAIKERDRLKKELEKGRIQRMSFNAARNKVVRLNEKAKKEAVINEIDNSKLNSRVLIKEDLEEHFSYQSETDESSKLAKTEPAILPQKKYSTYSMSILSLLLITSLITPSILNPI